MVAFEELLKEICSVGTCQIQGIDYEIKNYVAAVGSDVLKINICLVSDNSTLTIFTELKKYEGGHNKLGGILHD